MNTGEIEGWVCCKGGRSSKAFKSKTNADSDLKRGVIGYGWGRYGLYVDSTGEYSLRRCIGV
jgi:hypothetical protein